VLEINDNPSLDIYFDQLFMQHKVHNESDICPVDLYVKARVVTDAIKLSMLESPPSKMASLTKIYP
jgi:hypothetical protein